MKVFLSLVLFMVALAVPASATEIDGGDLIESVSVSDPASLDDPSDPAVAQNVATAPEAVSEDEASDPAPLASSDFSGGYYFVCDCVLGYDLKFYVPLEWAVDIFALTDSGSLVNMSNSTCYAYCPNYPDYTFQCNRFGEFTYRSSNYNSVDLHITEISESNITFLDNEVKRISDSDILFLIAAMVLLFGFVGLIRWR